MDDAALVNAAPCTQVGPFFQGGFRMEIWPSMMSGASRVSCFTGAFAVRSRQRAVWESSVRRPVRGLWIVARNLEICNLNRSVINTLVIFLPICERDVAVWQNGADRPIDFPVIVELLTAWYWPQFTAFASWASDPWPFALPDHVF